jgi:hypothetical protein
MSAYTTSGIRKCTALFAVLEAEAAFGSGRIDFEMDAFIPLGIDSFCIQIA